MSGENTGVAVPQETIADSTAKKKAKRTLRQLPIYRDASNLKYMVVCFFQKVLQNVVCFCQFYYFCSTNQTQTTNED